MKNNKVLLKKYMVVVIGQIILGIGCAFMITSGMGNDPMGVMVSGFASKRGMSYGNMNNLVSAIIFGVMWFLYRKRLNFTTLITVFVLGWTIDPVVAILAKFTVSSIVNNYVYPLVGTAVIALGVAVYLCVDMGASITDNVILFVCDKANKPYSYGCYVVYAVYFTLGFFTGGVWGYATVLSLLFTGPIIDKFLEICKPTIAVWANKE